MHMSINVVSTVLVMKSSEQVEILNDYNTRIYLHTPECCFLDIVLSYFLLHEYWHQAEPAKSVFANTF